MDKPKARKTLLITFIVLILAGCSSPATRTRSPVSSPKPETAQPSPQLESATFASALPTPNPGWATVSGRLVNAEDGTPFVGVMVFLEHTTKGHKVPKTLYAPPNDQPRDVTNETGQFIISEVPDGEYAVILYSPPFALQVVTKSDGRQPMLINAKAGKVINIDTVKVKKFELP